MKIEKTNVIQTSVNKEPSCAMRKMNTESEDK